MATQNYNTLKNSSVLVPATSSDLGTLTQPYGNLYLAGNLTLGGGAGTITATSTVVPKISGLTYPNGETAAIPTGGETIIVNGSGFLNGINVYVNNLIVGSTSLISGTQISFTSPVLAAGNYPLAVVNSDGGSATFVAGITYSNVPVWTTSAGSLGTYQEGNTVLSTLAATDGALSITYSITSGSLPGGLSLGSANGNITGTLSNVVSSSVTYNFTVGAADPANQVVTRNFSYVINGDSITWSNPTNASSYNLANASAMSNITLSATSAFGRSVTYNAVCLPTGVSLSGGNITGTPTVTGTKTATIYANTNTKSASISVTFKVADPTVAATGGTVTTVGCYKIHTFICSGAFTVTAPGSVEIVAVAGGGAGGSGYGGGGAGGIIYHPSLSVTSQTYTISIGAGGTAVTNRGHNGSDTTALGLTAKGGGGGGGAGYYPSLACVTGADGGSGGGGGGESRFCGPGGGGKTIQACYTVTGATTYGHKGAGYTGGCFFGAGGGGGAGAAGIFGSSYGHTYIRGGAGGAGIVNPISGSTIGQCVSGTRYIGGGGGSNSGVACNGGQEIGAGGIGGGGNSGDPTGCLNRCCCKRPGKPGTVNTGGGGGGGAKAACAPGGRGGSGVVIVKYKYQ